MVGITDGRDMVGTTDDGTISMDLMEWEEVFEERSQDEP